MYSSWRGKTVLLCVEEAQHTCCTSSAADGLLAGLGWSILSTTDRKMGRCASRTSGLPAALSLGTFSPATQCQGFTLQPGIACSARQVSKMRWSMTRLEDNVTQRQHRVVRARQSVHRSPVAHSYRVAPRLKMSAAGVGLDS